MVYGSAFNVFLKSFTDLTDEEKVRKLRETDTGDLLTILRNIEESAREYSALVIKSVYDELFSRGIMCI
jgi:hypothetical protein